MQWILNGRLFRISHQYFGRTKPGSSGSWCFLTWTVWWKESETCLRESSQNIKSCRTIKNIPGIFHSDIDFQDFSRNFSIVFQVKCGILKKNVFKTFVKFTTCLANFNQEVFTLPGNIIDAMVRMIRNRERGRTKKRPGLESV